MQLRNKKSHLLSSTTLDTFQQVSNSNLKPTSGPRRTFLSTARLQARIFHYQFETTFGPYVMDTGEKVVFYLIFFLVLMAVIMLVYYVLSFLVSKTAPSLESTVREFFSEEVSKLRVEPLPRREYQPMENVRPVVAL